MCRNSYEGVLEAWKVDLATRRARQRGWRGHDLDDALQEVIVELLAFRYDPARSNGASEATAVTAVIDNRLAMMCRAEMRYRQRWTRFQEEAERHAEEKIESTDLAYKVREALETLSPLQRRISEALGQGQTVSEIAKDLGRSRRAVRDEIFRIRRSFESMGLGRRFMALGREEIAA